MHPPQDLEAKLPDSEEKEEAEVHLEEVLDHLEEAVAEEILEYSKPGGEELFLQNLCLGVEDHLLGNPYLGEAEFFLHESFPGGEGPFHLRMCLHLNLRSQSNLLIIPNLKT